MTDKEDEKMPTSTPYKQSPKRVRDDVQNRKLRAIANSIDFSKLDKKESLSLDEFGRVKIDPTHPDYRYWTEDD
ncbi:hypothetical protein F3157_11420 [Virgibacillus dakarensis]|uniref:Uncharacterized protein n=1 Tax=Lentibacillus populi TaxID=1827502 RepID=A0A9W5TZQ2_9BACI|nr:MULTISPECIES: hypothetical protein [Bacillaceae]MBT2218663.1 hypothetical protein [Virgibacillus dakarensis]MTW86262.1 hypothetical protein [Virgibacillus dakarensis]GGB50317.1 hypothetical protein GCM10011409_29900 [Lentibacillus populi]